MSLFHEVACNKCPIYGTWRGGREALNLSRKGLGHMGWARFLMDTVMDLLAFNNVLLIITIANFKD